MKIICIGRNYAAHARELGNEVPEEPVLFMKPETSVVLHRQPFFIPDFTQDVHYEAEVVVRINRLGKHIEERFAHKYYDAVTLGIDFTARDLQAKLKAKGLPWERAKAFDGSAVVGTFLPKDKFAELNNLNFELHKNGIVVQKGNTSNMLNSIDQIIAFASQYFTLKIGDLIFTGTPEGVGKVQANDALIGYLESQKVFELSVK
jgi:2-keto-4-pentenoate hydratase/2-oxohepta-3-ene-1,7-dioic acid hydratase in catechol pathway